MMHSFLVRPTMQAYARGHASENLYTLMCVIVWGVPSIRQHTSAYMYMCYSVGRTQHTSAYVSIRQHTCTCAIVWGVPSIRQHTSAYMYMWYVIPTCCMRINVVLRLPRHFDERLWAWYENVRPYASACMCVHMRLHVCACVKWASVCVCVCVCTFTCLHTYKIQVVSSRRRPAVQISILELVI
jgi:hypothetical protein